MHREISSIHAAALVLGAAGLLSRILGVFRDRLFYGTFGAGRELDIYAAAFQIPDFMAALFLLGAAGAAILPLFQEYAEKSHERAQEFLSELVSLFLAGAGCAALIAFFLLPRALPLLVPGFSSEEQAAVLRLSRIMLFSPIFLGLSSIFSSVAQARARFFAYAAAPILYNLGIIFGVLFFLPVWGLSGLAGGVVLGAALHLLIQLGAAATLGFTPGSVRFRISPGIRRVAQTSVPRVLAVSFSQLTLIFLVSLGSFLAVGSIAVFQLAQNLYYIPAGIVGVSYATALFPRLASARLRRDGALFFADFFSGVRSIVFWVFPAAVFMVILRNHIVRVAVGTGAFSWEDARLTSAALAALSAALVAGALLPLLLRTFYALENTWIPFFVNAASSLISVGTAFWLSLVLEGDSFFKETLFQAFRISDLPHAGALGLALGFSFGFLVDVFLLFAGLRFLSRRTFGNVAAFPWKDVGVMAASALCAGVVAYVVRASFSETVPLITFLRVLGQGVAAGAAGSAAYFGFLYLAGNEEMRSVIRSLRRRFLQLGVLPRSLDGSEKL